MSITPCRQTFDSLDRVEHPYEIEVLHGDNVLHRLKLFAFAPLEIPLHVHFVTVTYNGETRAVNRANIPFITNIVPIVNEIWSAAGIQFHFDAAQNTHWPQPIEVNDRTGAFVHILPRDNRANTDLHAMFQRGYVRCALNVYIAHGVATEDPPGQFTWKEEAQTFPILGLPGNLASYAPEPCILVQEGIRHSPGQWHADFIPLWNRSEAVSDPELHFGSTLAHEIGHFFRLPHLMEKVEYSDNHGLTAGIDPLLRASRRCLMHWHKDHDTMLPVVDDTYNGANNLTAQPQNPFLLQYGCFTARRYARYLLGIR